jgi:squalene-hopene/tetraprenyl-beta-curcumene cyclase
LAWLVSHQNSDGGWGDTSASKSNLSTTLLVVAAFHLTGRASLHGAALRLANDWVVARAGSTPAEWAEAVRASYGKDRTFSVPILTNCALAGLVPWSEVPSLPFELACLPQSWYRLASLPVVSYALPALIAIGQCIHAHRPTRIYPLRWLRSLCRAPSLRVLTRLQPTNGGFLEATPLTAFVAMALASSGNSLHPVAVKGCEFLEASVRPDGSWPIDTNLSTWVTTLAVNALAAGNAVDSLGPQEPLRQWLVSQQYRERHPFTGAAPGGWAWTPLPGGVPDADDTPGALIALRNLGAPPGDWLRLGFGWLAGLQNRDGGMPTFCRGWGTLPFDRSGTDLTAHVLRALAPWRDHAESDARLIPVATDIRLLFEGGLDYLTRTQRPDGSWLPLWFGHEDAQEMANPVFGTARVLMAYRDLGLPDVNEARRGVAFLVSAQNTDGSWSGDAGISGQVEETALALDALIGLKANKQSIERGLAWLVRAVLDGCHMVPSPIGFYFARLWYSERLYPIIFSVAALGRARTVR